VVVLDVC